MQGFHHTVCLEYVLYSQAVVAVFNTDGILDLIHISRRCVVLGQVHRHHVRLVFFDELQVWLQIFQGMELLIWNVVFVYILFGKYPHGAAADFLFTGHAVGLSAYFCCFPETGIDAVIHFFSFVLQQVVQFQERALLGILEIIVGPGAGEAHIPLVAGIDDYLHLLVIIAPAYFDHVQFHADFFCYVFVDFLQHQLVVALGISYLVPGQLNNLFSFFIGFCFFSAACEHSCGKHCCHTEGNHSFCIFELHVESPPSLFPLSS